MSKRHVVSSLVHKWKIKLNTFFLVGRGTSQHLLHIIQDIESFMSFGFSIGTSQRTILSGPPCKKIVLMSSVKVRITYMRIAESGELVKWQIRAPS